MKKIIILVLSLCCSFSVFGDATLDDLLTELELIRDQQSSLNNLINYNFTPNYEEGASQNIYDLLWYALDSYNSYPSIQEMFSNFDALFNNYVYTELPDYFNSVIDKLDYEFFNIGLWLDSFYYFFSHRWEAIDNGFNQNHYDLVNIVNAIDNLIDQESSNNAFYGGHLEMMSDNLSTLVDLLSVQGGGDSSDLPKFSLAVQTLTTYGKDVDINEVSAAGVDTDGKFYNDMIKLTKFVAETEGSINNAALSILTNVQIIATIMSEQSQEEEVDKAVEDLQREAQSTKEAADRLKSEDVQSFFGFKNLSSQVVKGLQLQSAPQGDLSSSIFVTDRFYYYVNGEEFTVDSLEYDISDDFKELIKYGRMIVQFIYWGLSFLVTYFIFKWVYRILYTFLTCLGS